MLAVVCADAYVFCQLVIRCGAILGSAGAVVLCGPHANVSGAPVPNALNCFSPSPELLQISFSTPPELLQISFSRFPEPLHSALVSEGPKVLFALLPAPLLF